MAASATTPPPTTTAPGVNNVRFSDKERVTIAASAENTPRPKEWGFQWRSVIESAETRHLQRPLSVGPKLVASLSRQHIGC